MVKIVKFGGSSLADAHQFKKVGDIIKSDQIVVLLYLQRLVNVLKMISKLLIYYTKHITQKVNKSLNVLSIQSKIVIKVLSMNLI